MLKVERASGVMHSERAGCQERTPNFQFEASRKKFRGQYNFFSVLPFCHYNCQSAIAFLDAQMHKRYDMGRWGQ